MVSFPRSIGRLVAVVPFAIVATSTRARPAEIHIVLPSGRSTGVPFARSASHAHPAPGVERRDEVEAVVGADQDAVVVVDVESRHSPRASVDRLDHHPHPVGQIGRAHV